MQVRSRTTAAASVPEQRRRLPFQNNGGDFKNGTFEVAAYSWDDTVEQPFNFKWRDVEISWYKHMRRGTSVNCDLSNDTIATMLCECLESLSSLDNSEAL